ncbi:MAG TPA: glycosyltransferase family 4 protein, partial [Solirubrobacteraceae bacterium]|nr:glycosyltransferase family 4 protein [Solirubrobacteraceae bacterium]
SELRAWSATLRGELRDRPPDAVLLHYSPFSYAHRGLPLFVRPVLSAARAAGVPLLTFAHETAYPWGRGGWRGTLWAATQRGALVELLRASAAVVVTSEDQRAWLGTRAWLPRRETRLAPVFSNLPPALAQAGRDGDGRVIGLFGYAYQGAELALVLDALRLLHERAANARLVLLGAPGRASPAAEEWLRAARARGVESLLSFVGPLPAQELSDRLAACEVLLSCPRSGPTSRKGTLAASLASGAPVVAIDGPRTWAELVRAEAALVLPAAPEPLAEGLAELLRDDARRAALGARGRAFADSHMSLAGAAHTVRELLDDLLERRASALASTPGAAAGPLASAAARVPADGAR